MLELLLQQQLVDPQQAVTPGIMICNDKNLWPILCVPPTLDAAAVVPSPSSTSSFDNRCGKRRSKRQELLPHPFHPHPPTHLWSSMGTSEAASNGSGATSPSGNSTPASAASTADIWATNFCHCSSCPCFCVRSVQATTTRSANTSSEAVKVRAVVGKSFVPSRKGKGGTKKTVYYSLLLQQ